MTAPAPDPLDYFPYERPYEHQREAMERIGEALASRTDVCFEGATGTGKTLAALAPALAYAESADKTVVITTNVHQQMRQFRREASAIVESEPIRAVVFRGKSSMCHIDVGYQECQALRDTTHELVDAEVDLAELERRQRDLLERMQATDGKDVEAVAARRAIVDELEGVEEELAEFEGRTTCDHYYANLTGDSTDFYAWLFDDVRSPDDIYEYADRHGFCGYELLKDGVEGVDLVVCNYHHLLDPTIREQFFRWLGTDPEDVIAVFDEAHNVEDAARDHARRTLTEQTLERALDELEGLGGVGGEGGGVSGGVGGGDSEAEGNGLDDPRAESAANVLSTFLRALRTAYREAFSFGEREQVGDEWHDLAIDNEDRRDDLTLAFLDVYTGQGFEADLEEAQTLGEELDRRYDRQFREGTTDVRKECPTRQAAAFVSHWLNESGDVGTYPVVSVRRRQGGAGQLVSGGRQGGGMTPKGNDRSVPAGSANDSSNGPDEAIYGRAELYTCIPERVTRELFDDLHASVLMSATLRPFEVTETVIGLDEPATMAYGQQFPPERRRTYAVDGPALFASKRDDPSVVETITNTLEDVVRFTPGNVLCFFPSYREASRYAQQVSGGTSYLDEAGTSAEQLREEFTAGDDGVLFTSLWGTLGEGVSFDGDDARAVVVVGVPYPRLDERLEAVQGAYTTVFDDVEGGESPSTRGGRRKDSDDRGWEYAVEVPTIRKTRQALGRVIRAPDDFGVRILLDARYTERATVELSDYAVRGTFPPDERSELIDVQPEKLKFGLLNFFSDLDAWKGDPPDPTGD